MRILKAQQRLNPFVLSRIDESLGYSMDFTVRGLRRRAAQLFRTHNLSITMDQWAILNITKDHGGTSHLTLLSQLMVKDPPTVTKMVDSLCKKAYLRRELDEKDRRKWNILITKEGLAVEAKAFLLVQQIRSELQNALSKDEIAELKRILTKINRYLEKS